MNIYNIYYAGSKINNMPLNENELKEIFKRDIIYKNTNNVITQIPVKGIRVVKCIAV